jgi:hypothetical protein
MSLNARVGLALLIVLVSVPLWLPLAPIGLWWLHRERARGRAAGLRYLPHFMMRTVTAYAEATLPAPPPDGWQQVARNVDAYLAAIHSPRHWRTSMVLAMLEFMPCLRLRRPLSRQPLAARQRWIARRLSTTRGLLAVPALARQLVRMGYYADPTVAANLGFRSMRERVQAAARERMAVTAEERVGR